MTEQTSLETSKALWDKGYRGKHSKAWVNHWRRGVLTWTLCDIDEADMVNLHIPAYTFTELWNAMPNRIVIDDYSFYLKLDKVNRSDVLIHRIGYYDEIDSYWGGEPSYKEILAEAVAQLMLWLIDNGHIKEADNDK